MTAVQMGQNGKLSFNDLSEGLVISISPKEQRGKTCNSDGKTEQSAEKLPEIIRLFVIIFTDPTFDKRFCFRKGLIEAPDFSFPLRKFADHINNQPLTVMKRSTRWSVNITCKAGSGTGGRGIASGISRSFLTRQSIVCDSPKPERGVGSIGRHIRPHDAPFQASPR